ncbi:MAG: bifunctional riboflavin kinase/FAD synthetase [Deltaproteobacteria bacterium]|jgi:riboflavin kinase/FMN adenylyltransferase|nr:bifunctional riboflavin kinase/FAD synthetase [Deltaproteobacteria bacterium]
MQIIRKLNSLNLDPRRTVLTIGNFDGVHLGHREIFRRVVRKARETGTLSAVLTFEPHPLRLLAPERAPLRINTPEEKVRLLKASCIDLLVVLPFTLELADMPAEDFVRDILVQRLNICQLVVGYDYAFGRNREGDIEFLKEQGIRQGFELEILEPISDGQQVYSSTRIRNLLSAGAVADVIKLLGRNFTLDGQVVHGRGLGTELGFPTANLSTAKELLPGTGVYAVKVKWCDQLYDGVVNIGHRPTFSGTEKTLEIHLIDFHADLYGEHLRIYFVDRMRDERQFPRAEDLQDAVKRDINQARQLLADKQIVVYREYLDCGEMQNGADLKGHVK